MARYKNDLPQLSGDLFLTDGGLETTPIFHDGIDLPYFAAFDLLKRDEGYNALAKYFDPYVGLARQHQVGFILESATWRANPDWGDKLGYSRQELAELSRRSVQLLHDIRDKNETDKTKMVISGCIGPRGDGYNPAELMSEAEAQQYHFWQAETLRDAGVDMISALTITNVPEAIGITRAAQKAAMPVVISFTLETDGRLPTAQTLQDAIEQMDKATGNAAVYYMINCAHPTHFADALAAGEAWTERIRGIRANASTRSHAELDEATELDDGNPQELAAQYRQLRGKFKNLNVLGGCCGTDHRHIEQICTACLS